MNLVTNAIKFTDEGRVDVTVEQKGTVVEVRVRDTGIGIGKEDLEQLFRPFGRIAVPGRLTEGTGLGLYLSKKTCPVPWRGYHGGERAADKGSVFTFSFPVTVREAGGSMTKVLVIEDNEKNRYLISFILKGAGYEVIEAITGEEGVEVAIREHPDLILMDIQLPGIDGYEATRRIRASPAGEKDPHYCADFLRDDR